MSLNKFTKSFAIGIPAWIVTALGLNYLNQPSSFSGWGDGAGVTETTSIFFSKASYLIAGYFLFSVVIAAKTSTRAWRMRFSVIAHLFLLASIIAAILPSASEGYATADKTTMQAMILLPSYFIFFAPWIVTWVKFVKSAGCD